MPDQTQLDPFAPFDAIMRRHGVQCSAAEFHAAVNVVFHRFESEVYDQLHRDMWESLPYQIALLAEACLRQDVPGRLHVLDIGCGTGLAADSLLRSALGPRIATVDLLDTSSAMLTRAQQRRAQWGKPGETIEGLLPVLAGRKTYGLIITSSVLHHVPDVPEFLHTVANLQQDIPGALFLHLQDPNRDFQNDPQLRERTRSISQPQPPVWMARLAPRRVLGRLMREIKGQQGQDYISKTNRELIQSGVISQPLSVEEIFSITDVQVAYGGISIESLQTWLPDYRLVARRSYAFFGVLRSSLPPHLQVQEDRFILDGALNGEYIAAAWRRR
jgi:2-polyprenyl-3-methyl-5-hydroxy-6-metoxy-1,4-benzoquinol methylase